MKTTSYGFDIEIIEQRGTNAGQTVHIEPPCNCAVNCPYVIAQLFAVCVDIIRCHPLTMLQRKWSFGNDSIIAFDLPQFNAINEQYKYRITQQFGSAKGYDYAYFYPGLQKVVPAARSVIRTPQDRSILYLLCTTPHNSYCPRGGS